MLTSGLRCLGIKTALVMGWWLICEGVVNLRLMAWIRQGSAVMTVRPQVHGGPQSDGVGCVKLLQLNKT